MLSIKSANSLCLFIFSLVIQSQLCFAQPEAKQELQREITKALRMKLEAAVKDQTKLHGCWADISTTDKGDVVIAVTTDESKEVEQLHVAEITSLAKAILANQPERLAVEVKVTTRLPFSRFIKTLRSELETDADSAGTKIQSGFFTRASTDDELALELLGQTTTTEKRERVLELATQSFQRLFAGASDRVRTTRTSQVKVLVDPGRAQAISTELRTELQRAVRENPVLQGCWVDVNKTQIGDLEIKALVDSVPDIESKQVSLIDALVTRYSGQLQSRVTVAERLPVSAFIKALKDEVEFNPEYHGMWIERAYLNPPSQVEDKLDVILVGRVVDTGKRESLLKLANEMTSKFFGGLTERVSTAKTTADGLPAIEVQSGSSARAAHCGNEGVDAYLSRDYFAAYNLFTQASIENPTAVHLKYWRVVSLIGQGRDDLAFPIVKHLVTSRNQISSKDPAVLIPFENVQGRVRFRLIAMEKQVFCRCSDPSCKCK